MFRYKLIEALKAIIVKVQYGMTAEDAARLLDSLAVVLKTIGIEED